MKQLHFSPARPAIAFPDGKAAVGILPHAPLRGGLIDLARLSVIVVFDDGVLAHARGVRIERLELGEPARVQMQPLGQFCQPLKVVDDRERYCVENYLSVLIAGNLGIKIRMERELGMIGPNNPLARRKVAFRKLNPLPELEEAYALAFAWLKDADGGNPERTIERLYHLTGKFLRADRQVRQLETLAIALLQRKSLCGEEIKQVLMRVTSE